MTSPIGVPVWAPTAPRLIQLPANAPMQAAQDSSSPRAPATHMGQQHGARGSWFDLAQL